MAWLGVGVAYSLTYLLGGYILRDAPRLLLWFRTVSLLVPPLLGVVVIVRRRVLWTGCQWIFWATISLGLVVSAIGFLGWTFEEVLVAHLTSWLGWHAVFGLFGTGAPLLALLAQPHRGPRETSAPTTAVDIAGIAVLAGFLYAYVVVGQDVQSVGAQRPAVSLAFLSVFQQILVCAGMLAAALVARGGPWELVYKRLTWGAVVGLATLSLTNLGILQRLYRTGSVYEFTWILPFFFFPWAATVAPASRAPEPELEEAPTTSTRPWVIFGALALIPLLDQGLRVLFPLATVLEPFRDLSMAVTLLSILPLLMARLVVERAAVRRADARLHLLATAVDRTDDLIWIARPDGTFEHANPALCRALGYEASELTTMRPQDLLADPDVLGPDGLGRALATQGPWRGSLVRRRRDGTTFTTASVIVTLVDSRQQPLHLVGVERDVTEDLRLRQQLVESEQRYRSLFDQAPLGICRATAGGHILAANQTLARIVGYQSGEALLGVDVSDLHQDPVEGRRLLEAWRRQGAISVNDLPCRRRDGSTGLLRLSGGLARDVRTGEDVFDVFAEDVTDQRELEEELRQAQKMEAIGRLAGGVAHDFNNQLTVILGYSDLLLSQIDEGKPLYEDLVAIRHASETASALTRQLLAFSRRQLMKLEVLDLSEVVGHLMRMLGRLLGEDILVDANLAAALPLIKADASQLEHVLMNLAVNARDAMPQGGTLTLETAVVDLTDEFRSPLSVRIRAGRYVSLVVTDTGCGMDAETRGHLFEPFFTTKGQGRGTGLGLATVYGIVKQLRGYVLVYSEPQRGTTFKLYFPVVAGVARPVTVPALDEVGAKLGRETILLVEDEDSVRRFAATVLRRHGYKVVEAASAEDALAIAPGHSVIDLVLTDVVLPGLAGPDLLTELRNRRAVKGLCMSGYTERVLRGDLLDGRLPFLAKPFQAQALLAKVREVLDRTEA